MRRVNKKEKEAEVSPWQYTADINPKIPQVTQNIFKFHKPSPSRIQKVSPPSFSLPKKLSAILSNNKYDKQFSRRENSIRQRSFEMKKKIEVQTTEIQKCLDSNNSLLFRLRGFQRTNQELQEGLQELVLLQVMRSGLVEEKRKVEWQRTNQQYEYLFPRIHNSRHIINRKHSVRQKLNDLIIPINQ